MQIALIRKLTPYTPYISTPTANCEKICPFLQRTPIRDYTISVLNQLTNSLLPDHITLLDELLSFMDDKAVYKLTSLKSFNHSIRPKAIKENAIELASIQDIHDQLLPIGPGVGIDCFAAR